jgi:signal peptidase I
VHLERVPGDALLLGDLSVGAGDRHWHTSAAPSSGVEQVLPTASPPAPAGADVELLRQQTVDVLASIAHALETAAQQRRGLVGDIHSAEQALLGLAREREQSEARLIATRIQLNEASIQLDANRAQQVTLVSKVERLLSAGLSARAAVLAEVATLERRHAELAAMLARASLRSAALTADRAAGLLPAIAAAESSAAGAESGMTHSAESRDLHLAGLPLSTGVVAPRLSDRQRESASWSADHLAPRLDTAPGRDASSDTPSPTAFGPVPERLPPSVPAAAQADRTAANVTLLLDGQRAPAEPSIRTARLPSNLAPPGALLWGLVVSVAGAVLQSARRLLHPSSRVRSDDFSRFVTWSLVVLLVGLALLLTPITQVFGGLQLLAVTSASMEPTIPVGGVIGIRPVPAADLKVGDIVTFVNQNTPDVLITHRVVSIDVRDGQTMLGTKGDANDSVDALSAPAGRAVGRVEFSLAYLGYLMVWLSSPAGKIGLVGVAVLGLALPVFKRSTPAVSTRSADSSNLESFVDREPY